MEKPISVGDLVVVVRPNYCGCSDKTGLIFRVLKTAHTVSQCGTCERGFPATAFAYDVIEGRGAGFGFWQLKRIPPLADLEGKLSEDAMDIFDFLDV